MAIYKTEHFGIARKIVSNMTSQSWEEIPHATMSYDADVTDLLKEIKKLNEGVTDKSKKISINTVVLKIICEGLKAAPKMNCTLDFNRKLVRGTLYYHDNIDISMPMILHNGEMMTVNMHNMENKSLSQMTDALNDTIRRANNTDLNEVMFEVSMDNTIKGLKKGNLILSIDKKPIIDIADVQNSLQEAELADYRPLLLQIKAEDQLHFVALKPAKEDK